MYWYRWANSIPTRESLAHTYIHMFLRTPDGFFHPFRWWQGSSLIRSCVEKPLYICMFVNRWKGGEGGRISNWIKFLLSPFAPRFNLIILRYQQLLSLCAFLHFPSFPSQLSFYSTLLCITRVFHFFCFLHTSCSIPRSVLSSLPQ